LRDPADGRVVSGGVGEWEKAIRGVLEDGAGDEGRRLRRKRTVEGRKWEEAFQRFWGDGLL
jgi:hypothetical protein